MRNLARWSAFGLLLALLLWQQLSNAIDFIQIDIKKWATENVAAKDFSVHFSLSQNGLGATLSASRISLPLPLKQLTHLRLNCPRVSLQSNQFSCQEGVLKFSQQALGAQTVQVRFVANPDNTSFYIKMDGLTVAGGQLDLDVKVNKNQWQAFVVGQQVEVSKLEQMISPWLSQQQLDVLAQWQYDGITSFNAELNGVDKQLSKLESTINLQTVNFSNQEATQVAEGLTSKIELSAKLDKALWSWQSTMHITEGQSYADPVFLDYSTSPVFLTAQGSWMLEAEKLAVTKFNFEQKGVLSADAKLQLDQQDLKQLTLHAEITDLASFYPVWLQPFLLGTSADKLQLHGAVAIDVNAENDVYQVAVQTDSVTIHDQHQRFAVDNLNGTLAWSTNETALSTQLAWQDAQIYAVDIGAASLSAVSQNNGMQLSQDLDLPVMDGLLKIQQFALQYSDKEQLSWSFDGLVTPISLEVLSQALAWPTLHGKLSGVIPNVSYQNHELKVDGALQVKVFGGTTVIKDLRMTSPFGALPQLYANIDIDDLDMDLLTQTFDFGRISGNLQGYVHDLRLSNWQPVQFDAYLATAEQNPGKRRISQRAVDNLSQIGGGASGLLSRSFLGFFEDFSYKKLGLACRLRNEICEMTGIDDAKQGYYIVKGGGGLPPWIDVVGYTRRVDWAELIARLKAVSESSGPVVE